MDTTAMKSAIVSIAILTLAFGCASQNEVATIDNRITELEMRNAEARKKSEALKNDIKSREGEEQALRHQAATLRQQIAALNEEIRVLSGRIEELEFTINRQKQKEAEAIEPNIKTFQKALYSPDTASVDPKRVCQSLKEDLEKEGVQFRFQTKVLGRREWFVQTNQGDLRRHLALRQ